MVIFYLAIIIFVFYTCFVIYAKVTSSYSLEQKAVAKGANFCVILPHVYGLPIAENMMCAVYSKTDSLEFEVAGASYQLSKDKILDISFKTDKEISKQAVSSAGGAVAGALMLGALGAMIGGRAKTKTVTQTFYYLIITYRDSDDNIKYLAFDSTRHIDDARRIIKDFTSQSPPQTMVL